MTIHQSMSPLRPRPRIVGRVNWIGLRTLYLKEVFRFFKVFTQTVAAPVVTTLLFYAIFALALGGIVRMAGTVPFLEFLAPGLIMMSMRSEEHTSELQSLMRISYAVFCLKKKTQINDSNQDE